MKANDLKGIVTARRLLSLAAVALAAASCDQLLDVEAPSEIPAENLEGPESADLLLGGAIGDFECAFGAYVVLGGVLSDELEDATQTAARWPYDQRDVDAEDENLYATASCVGLGVYTPLSTARWSAENILGKLEGWTDAEVEDRTSKIAAAAAYSGYSHLLLGEGFCSGVLLDSELEPGGEVSRGQLFAFAEERFTRAIEAAQASGDDEILNTALVGRARVRLDQGDESGAAADASLVAEGFERVATASGASSRRFNRVWAQNRPSVALTSVDPQFQDLEFGGVPDPRVPTEDTGETSPTGVRVVAQLKYTDVGDPLPIATWDEAQLIIAEVEGGQTAVDIINFFHDRAGLPPFASTDEAEIQAQVQEERKRELFLESHRFHDIERLGQPLIPAPGTPYRNGGEYGSTLCLPLPDDETVNNPNI
ncbi:MAG: RagB/SusD family nutrient uptake outer membrane protein [Longimicrobiaceae bacterium]